MRSVKASWSLALCALVLGLTYRRYLGILGADRRRPAERQAYDALRNSLAEGNIAQRLYAERLTRFLNWIDHFFGDAGKADQTLFPHAFGLRTPASLWTAPAFDRCLLLALIYPIATIFIIWTVSDHIGPAETALHLKPDFPGWQRGVGLAGLGCSLFLWVRPSEWKARLWRFASAGVGCAIAFALLRGAAVIAMTAFVGFTVSTYTFSGLGVGGVTFALYISAFTSVSAYSSGGIFLPLTFLSCSLFSQSRGWPKGPSDYDGKVLSSRCSSLQ
jgi:hypothetical protein